MIHLHLFWHARARNARFARLEIVLVVVLLGDTLGQREGPSGGGGGAG